ncbi:hypothetical protein BDN67DRAFT_958557 [Paxillus ammoniavirescens]|nr:hypothetical protein BDN67DRAFT_958557 [Paxillus ammoniavirescens]
MEDPNLAVQPDFNSEEYAEDRLQFIDAELSIDDNRAAHILSKAWRLTNSKDKDRWAARLAEQERVTANKKHLADEAEALRLQSIADDQQAAIKDERQKNKTKYAPYAARLLKKGAFCPLFYFTNKGLCEASHASLSSDAEAMVIVQGESGLHTFIPALAAKPPSPSFVADEDLSWEQFGEATPRMVLAMKNHDWPEDRVDMHIIFWSAIQTHPWRYSNNILDQRALITYQGEQRPRWHQTVGTNSAWSLSHINEKVLAETRRIIQNQSANSLLIKLAQVRPRPPFSFTVKQAHHHRDFFSRCVIFIYLFTLQHYHQ